jgi:hypothetical protein
MHARCACRWVIVGQRRREIREGVHVHTAVRVPVKPTSRRHSAVDPASAIHVSSAPTHGGWHPPLGHDAVSRCRDFAQPICVRANAIQHPCFVLWGHVRCEAKHHHARFRHGRRALPLRVEVPVPARVARVTGWVSHARWRVRCGDLVQAACPDAPLCGWAPLAHRVCHARAQCRVLCCMAGKN